MRTKDDIIKAIREKDRKNKLYVHPVIPPETLAKYISAFANSNGGDIIFGIHDDGVNLHTKKFTFSLQFEKVRKLLNTNINCIVDEIKYNGEIFPYISIDKSNELVEVYNIPYIINDDGVIVEMKQNKVFISYNHTDKDLADLIENSLDKQKDIIVTRDINVNNYRDDLDKFMKTIRDHDYIISIVTREYLMSLNCMYEITEGMKDYNFIEKLLFIIVNKEDSHYYPGDNISDIKSNVYEPDQRLEYIIHWDERYKDMVDKYKNADLPPENAIEYTLDIRKLKSVISSTSEFMHLLKDKIGRSFDQIQKNDFEILKDVIKGK
ncbi:RNA-binding domain-containing protein [Marinilactibacillus psychrotolerans]|uniref:RNA-binding domain-containing protein n=1 Tax=Marinilactibacillus psychrotolerans TaxID=191770 RepID=A0ABW8UG69_9LACT